MIKIKSYLFLSPSWRCMATEKKCMWGEHGSGSIQVWGCGHLHMTDSTLSTFIHQRDATPSGFQSFWRNINSATESRAQHSYFLFFFFFFFGFLFFFLSFFLSFCFFCLQNMNSLKTASGPSFVRLLCSGHKHLQPFSLRTTHPHGTRETCRLDGEVTDFNAHRQYTKKCVWPDYLRLWVLDTNTHICSAGDVSQN